MIVEITAPIGRSQDVLNPTDNSKEDRPSSESVHSFVTDASKPYYKSSSRSEQQRDLLTFVHEPLHKKQHSCSSVRVLGMVICLSLIVIVVGLGLGLSH